MKRTTESFLTHSKFHFPQQELSLGNVFSFEEENHQENQEHQMNQGNQMKMKMKKRKMMKRKAEAQLLQSNNQSHYGED